MSSVQPPNQNRPQDPYKYKVEEIQERHNKEEFSQEEHPPIVKRSAILNYFLLLFHKLLNLFETKSLEGLSSEEVREVKSDLSLFHAALLLLQREDRSQDSLFLNQLSQLWHIILRDLSLFKRPTPLTAQFTDFVAAIQSYPATQDHTLGYYLSECSGQRWLPFPYMEMVRTLHMHSQQDPISAPLIQWIAQIDQIIDALIVSKNGQNRV